MKTLDVITQIVFLLCIFLMPLIGYLIYAIRTAPSF